MDERLKAAIESGDLDEVETLFKGGVDVNAPRDGATALTLAVSASAGPDESLRRVTCLLRLGAKTSFEDGRGAGTSVHLAAGMHFVSVLKVLLRSDGTSALSKFDDSERTPLMCAVENRDLEVIQILLDAGADVNAHDEERNGDPAINIPLRKKVLDDLDVGVVEMLIRRGADPTLPGWMKMTAIDFLDEWRARGPSPQVDKLARILESDRF